MIESPVLQELKAEWTREAQHRMIVGVLVDRFGAVAEDVETELKAVNNETNLRELVKVAVTCPDLESFRARLGIRVEDEDDVSLGEDERP